MMKELSIRSWLGQDIMLFYTVSNAICTKASFHKDKAAKVCDHSLSSGVEVKNA
jgi:hypothetical protein